MARPLRLEFAGALYHVTARGDGREVIYLCDDDRMQFLTVLAHVCERFNWYCHAYCLMGNHYHLLVETPDANLSKGMRQLNGVYTQRFNRARRRSGHVFQGRFKAILVQKESYLLQLARYIVLNPVRAQLVQHATDWAWSSYRATAGITDVPDWLITDALLSAFGEHRASAIDGYKQFVAQGVGRASPWAQLKSQIYLGDDKFVEVLLKQIDPRRDLREVPVAQRCDARRSLRYFEQHGGNRDAAIRLAYGSGTYTLKQLGDHYGLHPSRVGRIIEKARSSLRPPVVGSSEDMSSDNGTTVAISV